MMLHVVKFPVNVKRSKKANNFFMTKATDLKTIYLKSPLKMHVKTCVTLTYLFKPQKNVDPFLDILFNPPWHPNY